MPICIECSCPVSHLYSTYSRADDRSLGKGVRLTQCPRCHRFADKYVEYDFVVLFIDLVLIKPQVYRHLLFNRLGRDDNKFDRSIIRLGVLLLLFDVYLTWARIEKSPSLAKTFLSRAPIVVQYLFFLSLNAAATLAHHLTVRLLASILVPKARRYGSVNLTSSASNTGGETTPLPSGPPTPTTRPSLSPQAAIPQIASLQVGEPLASPTKVLNQNDAASPNDPSSAPQSAAVRPPPSIRRTSSAPPQNIRPLPPPTAASPAAISTALLVSSCAKLFPILLVIWGADGNGGLSDIPAHSHVGAHVRAQAHSASIQSAIQVSTEAVAAATATVTGTGQSHSPLLSSAKATLSPQNQYTLPPPSSSFLESWLATTTASLHATRSTSYLTGIFDLLASLLSLGVVDTHLALLSNIEALYILLGCGYLRAVAVAVMGLVARWAVQRVILGAVGIT